MNNIINGQTVNLFGMGNCTTAKDFAVYLRMNNRIGIAHYNYATSEDIINIPLTENWVHIALVYNGVTEYLFVNGKQIFSKQIDLNTSDSYICINGRGPSGRITHHGLPVKYDEFRISNVARWTKDFIPPNYPYNRNTDVYLDKNNFIYGVI